MSKVIKAAAVAFAVTFIVVTGAAFLLTGSFAAGTVAATFGASALAMSTLSAVSTLVMGLISKDPEVSSQNFGTKFAGRSPTAPRQIIYGKARVGGTITHMQTSGTDNNLLSIIVVLAGHEVEDLETVRVNDTNLTTTSSGGFQYATNSEFTNSDNDNKFSVSNSLLRFRFKDGSQTTADSTIVGATNLGNSDKFINCAYVLVQMVFDSEKFSSLPNLSFIVKGKKVYDPRNPSAAPAFSTNPALCIRDYLTDTQYGLKAKDSEILDTTAIGGFAGAANTCDTSVNINTATVAVAATNSTTINISTTSPTLIKAGDVVTGSGISGTVTVTQRRGNNVFLDTAVTVAQGVTLTFGQPAYTANGLADFSTNGKAVLEGLLSACAGKFSYVNGRFLMFAGASVTPEMTIEDDNVLSPISINTKSGQGESYNQVKSVFVDSNQNYTATDTPLYSDSTFLANDTPSGESNVNYKKTMELQHPFTDNATTAQRLNRISLNYSRQDMTCSVTTDLGYLQLQPFDVVRVTNSRLGFTNKQFEVINQKITIVGDQKDGAGVLGVQFELKEYDASIYTFAQSSYDVPPDSGDPDDTKDSSISAPAIASLTQVVTEEGAGYKNDIKVALTLQGHDKIIGTEIQYKLSTDSDYTGDLFIGKGVATATIPNVVIGKTYNVRAKHIANDGVTSDYSAASNISITDPTAISAPSSFTATSNPVAILLSWTNPNNHNLRAIKIYRHTANFTPTDDTYLVDTIMGEPNKIMKHRQGSMDGLTSGTTYYFAVRAITNTGVHSAFTSVVQASFLLDKTVVNLNDLGDLDNTANTKLGTIEENATVGAKAGVNLKDSGNQTINDLDIKNDELSIDFTGNTTFRLRKGSGGSITNIDTQSFSKANVGLSDLASLDSTSSDKLGTIEENATVGATAGSNLKDSGGVTLSDSAVKNSSITLAADGSLNNIGTTQVLSNSKIVEADLVGSGKTFAAGQKPNKTVLTGNNLVVDGTSAGAVKNSALSLSLSGTELSLSGGGGSAQTFDKGSVGLSDLASLDSTQNTKLTNIEAGATVGATAGTNLKESDGSVLGDSAVKNASITLATDGSLQNIGTTQILSNAKIAAADIEGTGKAFPANSVTKLGGIAENATVGATAGTDLKESDGSVLGDSAVKNASITLATDGSLENIGTSQVLSNSKIVEADLVGSGKTFAAGQKPNKTVLNGNNLEVDGTSQGAVKNSALSLSLSGTSLTLSGGGGSAQTFDKGSVGLSNLASLDSTANTKLSGIENNATFGAQIGTNLIDEDENNVNDADILNSSLQIDTSGTSIRIKKGTSVINTTTLDKGSVGLSNLASLDSTQNTKLTGIETGATVGARAGVNLKRNNNTVVGDADIITSEGTSDDTENVNSVAKADITGSITGTQTNVASIVQGLAAGTQSVSAGSLNAGSILTSLLKLDEILLQTAGTGSSGQSAVFGSSPTAVSLGSIGTGAGLYMGTVSIENLFGSSIRGGSIHLELRNASGTVQYERYFNPQIDDANNVYSHSNNYSSSDREIHLEFGHFFLGSGALNAFIVADSNGSSTTTIVKIRAVRFGAEVVSFNTSSFTASKTGQTAGADVDSGTVTVSGFTGTKTGTLTGHSSALVSINGGTFVNSSSIGTITANQTFELRLTASSTAGTTRSCTFDLDGTSVTYSVTTAGTYTPNYSGGGGGGSAGGGFENTTQLN